MQQMLIIKKLKKDCTIDTDISKTISDALSMNKKLIFPVDGIYGFLSVYSVENPVSFTKLAGEFQVSSPRPVIIVNFSMLEQISVIKKKDYDFLRRIWPDEINVVLNGNTTKGHDEKLTVRVPKYQFIIDIISSVSQPLVFCMLRDKNGKFVFRKKEITDKFGERADMIVYLNEWNHSHVKPTLIDVSSGNLEIIEKGRVAPEEIQSLYFLDTSDGTE